MYPWGRDCVYNNTGKKKKSNILTHKSIKLSLQSVHIFLRNLFILLLYNNVLMYYVLYYTCYLRENIDTYLYYTINTVFFFQTIVLYSM